MLQLFQYETQDIEVILLENVPWFHAAQVAKALGYSNPAQALQDNVSDKYIQQIDLGRPGKKPNFISEPGLYQLVIRSTLPSAEKFQDWVFEEVLPAIRQKGSYSINEIKPDSTSERVLQMLEAMQIEFNEKMNALTERTQKIDELQEELNSIEQASEVHPGCADVLEKEQKEVYPDDLIVTAAQYLRLKELDNRHYHTLRKTAAYYYRLGKQTKPSKNSRNQYVYRGSEILYLDEALAYILGLVW